MVCILGSYPVASYICAMTLHIWLLLAFLQVKSCTHCNWMINEVIRNYCGASNSSVEVNIDISFDKIVPLNG